VGDEGGFVGKSGNGWEFGGGSGKKFSRRIEKCPIL